MKGYITMVAVIYMTKPLHKILIQDVMAQETVAKIGIRLVGFTQVTMFLQDI